MIILSAILPAIAEHAKVPLTDVLGPIRNAFWHERGLPRDFRSDREPPSVAGSMKGQGRKICFPDAMPYIAGVACGDHVRLTAAEIAPGVLWYGDMGEAKLVLKKTSLPLIIIGSVAGQRLGDVVGHPTLAGLEDRILAAIENDGHTTFRTTVSQVSIEDPLDRPTPRADWNAEMEEMARRQGLIAA